MRPDEGSLRLAHEEAIRLFGRLLDSQAGLDAKAAQLMTLSATFGALLLGGLSIVAGNPDLEAASRQAPAISLVGTTLLAAGAGLLLVALLGSALSHSTGDGPRGLRPGDLGTPWHSNVPADGFLRSSLAAYIEGVRRLELKSLRAARRLRRTFGLFLGGATAAGLGGAMLTALGVGLGG